MRFCSEYKHFTEALIEFCLCFINITSPSSVYSVHGFLITLVLAKIRLKKTEIFTRLQYCFGPIVIDTNGSWCLSLKPCFSKRDETSVRSVNRVGEIYVGERETKGNQSFHKMFALWLDLALIQIHFKTTVSPLWYTGTPLIRRFLLGRISN